ncbi:MAG: TlpA family protein disulfide reductase [Bacteroidales bacterium]|nr:TlpA family protein disulfide reductase [Bacteroidales bacterium]
MKILFLLSFLSLFETGYARKISVYDFNSFEPLLHTNSDSVFILNFWASWCLPCREELPDFERLHKAYQSKKVKVLLVSLDIPGQVEKQLIPFLEKNDITADILLLDDPDFDKWINKIDSTWGGGIPATLIYSKDQRIFLNRKTTYEELESIVKSNF